MKKIILVFLLIISNNSFGEVVSLTCVDRNNKYTTNINFDEKNQTVTVLNKTMKATITEKEIFFKEVGSDNKVYLEKLNRSSGTLQIIDSLTSTIDSTYDCTISKKKF